MLTCVSLARLVQPHLLKGYPVVFPPAAKVSPLEGTRCFLLGSNRFALVALRRLFVFVRRAHYDRIARMKKFLFLLNLQL